MGLPLRSPVAKLSCEAATEENAKRRSFMPRTQVTGKANFSPGITSGLPVIRPQSLARINRSKEATLKDEPERRVVPADRTGELSEWSISSRKCKTRRGRQSIFLCAFESRSRLSLNGALSRPAAIASLLLAWQIRHFGE
jgi:hypothetical protein